MRRLLGLLMLLVFLPACGQAGTDVPPEGGGPAPVLPEDAPAASAPLEGDPLSPDGRSMAVARGRGGPGACPEQAPPADTVQIVDTETGEVLWERDGAYRQSIVWSPEGGFAALAVTARTWCAITIVETEGWTSWEFALPDGSPIPEHTFLPDDGPWGVWTAEGSLDLTIGRGGDAGAQAHYACAVDVRDGEIRGLVWEERQDLLPGSYDFDHDGEPEIVELVTMLGDEERRLVGWYELRVRTADGRLRWGVSFAEAHPGWGSCFACRVDGGDYLLRYLPTMYQGYADYTYELFSLSGTGEERVVRQGSVVFDMNFGELHERFEPQEIAAFLEEVHGLLEDSELLLSTEGGDFRSGGPGAEFRDDLELWTAEALYDEDESLEGNIRAIGAHWEEMRTAG
nr:hypothetical protein [uncultured Oscillibacter sp.]